MSSIEVVLRNVRKVSVRKHALLWGSGGMSPLPGKYNLEFRTSEMASAGFSSQGSAFVVIQL